MVATRRALKAMIQPSMTKEEIKEVEQYRADERVYHFLDRNKIVAGADKIKQAFAMHISEALKELGVKKISGRFHCEPLPPGNLKVECANKCSKKENCPNSPMHNMRWKRTEMFWTAAKGFGLKAKEAVKRGELVYEYTGLMYSEDEFDHMHKKRVAERARLGVSKHDFHFVPLPKVYLDPVEWGNSSMFINSSCDPNLAVHIVVVGSKVRLGFYAVRDIPVDEELTINYGSEYSGRKSDEEEVDKLKKCFCESPFCLRYMVSENVAKRILSKKLDDESFQEWKRQRALYKVKVDRQNADLYADYEAAIAKLKEEREDEKKEDKKVPRQNRTRSERAMVNAALEAQNRHQKLKNSRKQNQEASAMPVVASNATQSSIHHAKVSRRASKKSSLPPPSRTPADPLSVRLLPPASDDIDQPSSSSSSSSTSSPSSSSSSSPSPSSSVLRDDEFMEVDDVQETRTTRKRSLKNDDKRNSKRVRAMDFISSGEFVPIRLPPRPVNDVDMEDQSMDVNADSAQPGQIGDQQPLLVDGDAASTSEITMEELVEMAATATLPDDDDDGWHTAPPSTPSLPSTQPAANATVVPPPSHPLSSTPPAAVAAVPESSALPGRGNGRYELRPLASSQQPVAAPAALPAYVVDAKLNKSEIAKQRRQCYEWTEKRNGRAPKAPNAQTDYEDEAARVEAMAQSAEINLKNIRRQLNSAAGTIPRFTKKFLTNIANEDAIKRFNTETEALIAAHTELKSHAKAVADAARDPLLTSVEHVEYLYSKFKSLEVPQIRRVTKWKNICEELSKTSARSGRN